MATIHVNDIRVYAYHGCMPEEGVVGGNYRVDIWVEAKDEAAEVSDDLTRAIDYVVIHDIVKAEMAVRSKLIEHVARRIANKILEKYTGIMYIGEVTVTKLNPPINGSVGSVAAVVTF